jgi:hypothetical protein
MNEKPIWPTGQWREALKAKDAEIERLRYALEESVKLQSHYAMLLNMWDGGERMQFDSAQVWLDRLASIQRAREATR